MTKADKTRQHIIVQSATIINKKGMAGTSISDIENATNLSKGAIYGNFKNKDEICIEAYKYLSEKLLARNDAAIAKGKSSIIRFGHLLDSYAWGNQQNGGCPMLNFGVESDETDNAIRALVRKTIIQCQATIESVLSKGIRQGELLSLLNPKTFSQLTFSMLEGAVLCKRVLGNNEQMEVVIAFLKQELLKFKRKKNDDQTATDYQ